MDSDRSRVITALSWICLVVGLSSPLRIGLVLTDARLNVYCKETPIVYAYEIVLSSLTTLAGWGLVQRRRWAPVAAAVAGGATIALAAGSLFALTFTHVTSRTVPQGVRDFYAANWAFLLINSALLLGWLLALVAVFRGSSRKEFSATPTGPAILIAASVLSSGLCLGITWYFWTHFVL
jgi:hypothetical protein